MAARLDVVVVGAGLAGAAAAWELSRRGRSVALLDQFEEGHRRGSSHGTERIVRLGYTSVEYVQLGLEAMRGWRELEAEASAALLHAVGAIDLGYDDELRDVAAAFEACAVRYEWLPPAEAADRWPGLVYEGSVLHQPDGGWIGADVALRALVDGASHRGADVRWGMPVTAFERRSDRVHVVSHGQTFTADVVVVAAGAWAAKVLGGLVALPPIAVTNEQVAYFDQRPGAGPWPCFIRRAAPLVYGLPTPSGLVKVGEHQVGPVVDPDDGPFEPDTDASARLEAAVRRIAPGLEPDPLECVSCLYATTPTDDFVLDRRGQFVVAAGLGGHGFKFGPAIGRIVADLVTGAAADGTAAGPNPFRLGAGARAGPGRSGAR